MVQILLLCSVGLLACVGSSKLLYKLGIPTLILFIGLGMLTGSDGLGGFYFDKMCIRDRYRRAYFSKKAKKEGIKLCLPFTKNS